MAPGERVPAGLRERKKQQTRAALTRAAIRLTVERGFDDVTVEDVAAAAEVSVRTFRNYYSGKAEAIAAGHLQRALRIAEELRARPAAEPLWDALAAAVQAPFAPEPDTDTFTETGTDSPGARPWIGGLRLMLTEPAVRGEVLKADAAAQDALAAAIAERTGTAAEAMYPHLAAAVVSAALSVAVQRWLRSEEPGDIAPLLRDALAQVTAGLPAP
ncbi:TetR family transcriptional regulator [Murinocardiopsis flavida]|uniref:TetR family transcriptional regulator n=1 Tax=Murinocardiopsis flavida TaxID=645275 RepID=A0A2P8DP27_9ACTN|nr:TetR family transcriptional regulator [Murinocardiopsis flavida]PSK98965.1 TetR family transcriptional regulator [Murinocardiopsis flavida]